MFTRHHIGNILIHVGEPPGGNPYSMSSLLGEERVEAFRAVLMDKDISKWTFWYAPSNGGAFKLTVPKAQIDWTAMSDSEGMYVFNEDGTLR